MIPKIVKHKNKNVLKTKKINKQNNNQIKTKITNNETIVS